MELTLERARPDLAVLGAAGAGLAFVAVQVWAFWIAGTFEYPLDDVYIHLAMAEGIMAGTYGVNTGEHASAASSILYPLLLLPFPGSEFQRLLPLFWNGLAVVGCGWLWGRVLSMSELPQATALLLALFGPLALNMAGVGFTGMEHTLHTYMSLLVLLGLWRFLTEEDIAWWFVFAVVLSPLLRLEGLALSLSAAGIVAVRGRPGAAAAMGFGAVLPVLGFMGFLTSLGLDPLPSSVLAKMDMVSHDKSGLERLIATLSANLSVWPGRLLAALVILTLLVPVALARTIGSPVVWVLLGVGASGAAHLLFGQIGWMHRYEHYIMIVTIAALLLVSPLLDGTRGNLVQMGGGLAVLAAGAVFLPALFALYVWNTRAVDLQQVQMARLVQDHARVPVAVNDLGRVAWRNDHYVLDLWGLASRDARVIRTAEPPPAPGWAGPLATAQDVPLAMIYDRWLAPAVGIDWVPLAALTMDNPRGALGDWTVSFYATSADVVPEMRAHLDAFRRTLPEGVHLTMEGQAMPELQP